MPTNLKRTVALLSLPRSSCPRQYQRVGLVRAIVLVLCQGLGVVKLKFSLQTVKLRCQPTPWNDGHRTSTASPLRNLQPQGGVNSLISRAENVEPLARAHGFRFP